MSLRTFQNIVNSSLRCKLEGAYQKRLKPICDTCVPNIKTYHPYKKFDLDSLKSLGTRRVQINPCMNKMYPSENDSTFRDAEQNRERKNYYDDEFDMKKGWDTNYNDDDYFDTDMTEDTSEAGTSQFDIFEAVSKYVDGQCQPPTKKYIKSQVANRCKNSSCSSEQDEGMTMKDFKSLYCEYKNTLMKNEPQCSMSDCSMTDSDDIDCTVCGCRKCQTRSICCEIKRSPHIDPIRTCKPIACVNPMSCSSPTISATSITDCNEKTCKSKSSSLPKVCLIIDSEDSQNENSTVKKLRKLQQEMETTLGPFKDNWILTKKCV